VGEALYIIAYQRTAYYTKKPTNVENPKGRPMLIKANLLVLLRNYIKKI